MTIIKEFVRTTTGVIIILRTRTYGSSLQYLNGLYRVALRSFPGIEQQNVNVIQYGGERYKRTFGIEFFVPPGTEIPADYEERDNAEVEL